MQKGFAPVLILVGILVIIGVAAGAYFFGKSQVTKSESQNQTAVSPNSQPIMTPTSSSDETANWKTFSSKYGYSLRYPVEWGAAESVGSKGVVIWSKPEYLKLSEELAQGFDKEDFASIEVGIYSFGTRTAAGDVNKDTDVEKFVKGLFGANIFKSSQDISLDGKPAVLFTKKRMVLKPQFPRYIQNCPPESEPCDIEDGITRSVWLKTNEGIIGISYSYGRQYKEASTLDGIFNQILSTFKFTQ
jgi:hypothetical protein